jgi:hypothetical protein
MVTTAPCPTTVPFRGEAVRDGRFYQEARSPEIAPVPRLNAEALAAATAWLGSYHSKPVRFHGGEELVGDVESGPIADDAVDPALGTQRSLSLTSPIVVNSLHDVAWRELRTAIEATTERAADDLRAVVDRVPVRSLDVGREADDALLVIFLPTHPFLVCPTT